MKVAVLGGGPAGLYFAISLKLRDAAHEVTVYERNRADDTFGWGVVLSAETLENLAKNDPVSAVWIKKHFAYWDDIAVIHDGVRTVSSGHGFCGIGRKRLLILLQRRARELGIRLEFETDIADPRPYMESHDLVVSADGLNSRARGTFVDVRLGERRLRARDATVSAEDHEAGHHEVGNQEEGRSDGRERAAR